MKRGSSFVWVVVATVIAALMFTVPAFAQEKAKPEPPAKAKPEPPAKPKPEPPMAKPEAPAKAPAPKKETAPAKEKGEFAIARAVVGTGVENKELVGAADAFPASTEKVSCFIEATNVPKDMDLTTVWSMGDKEMRKINTTVKAGPRWRTWVDKKVGGMKGDWKVEIKDADGKVLKDVKFKVE
jgi:hypothetical protein